MQDQELKFVVKKLNYQRELSMKHNVSVNHVREFNTEKDESLKNILKELHLTTTKTREKRVLPILQDIFQRLSTLSSKALEQIPYKLLTNQNFIDTFIMVDLGLQNCMFFLLVDEQRVKITDAMSHDEVNELYKGVFQELNSYVNMIHVLNNVVSICKDNQTLAKFIVVLHENGIIDQNFLEVKKVIPSMEEVKLSKEGKDPSLCYLLGSSMLMGVTKEQLNTPVFRQSESESEIRFWIMEFSRLISKSAIVSAEILPELSLNEAFSDKFLYSPCVNVTKLFTLSERDLNSFFNETDKEVLKLWTNAIRFEVLNFSENIYRRGLIVMIQSKQVLFEGWLTILNMENLIPDYTKYKTLREEEENVQ